MKRFLFITAMAASGPVWAWGDLGHETTGEIAEQIIAQDAKTKNAVQAILGVEPLAKAAIFPDHVRDDGRFNDFAPYHFVTIYRESQTYTEKNALTILKKYPDVLTSRKYPREAKMIALRYLVHVVGDIHQPLHVGNEFDLGGNACQVKWQPAADKDPVRVNLHSAWDSKIVDHLASLMRPLLPKPVSYYGYKQLAAQLMERHADEIKDVPVDIDAWIAESQRLREAVVYPDSMADDARPYCNRNRDEIKEEDIPTLGPDYAAAKIPLVEKRLVVGGVRLAAVLKEIFSNKRTKKPVEERILEMLKLTNDRHH